MKEQRFPLQHFFTSRFCLVRRSICLERIRAGTDVGCLLLVALDIAAAWWSSSQTIWYKTRIRPGKSSNGSLRISHTLRDASVHFDNTSCVARTNRGKLFAKLGPFRNKLRFIFGVCSHRISIGDITNFFSSSVQGVIWPSMHDMTAKWIPQNERSRFVSAYLGKLLLLIVHR